METVTDFDILITCDIEPDFEILPERGAALSLSGIERAMPTYLKQLEIFEREAGTSVPHAFFVRCDDQMEAAFERAAFLLEKHKSLLRGLERRGHVIGFHPHLYSKKGASWALETDQAALVDQLRRVFRDFVASGFRPRFSRMGEGYATGVVLATLAELGVEGDFTVIPGLRAERDGAMIDWSGAQDQPQKLSARLVEVPFSMVSIRASYDENPRRRYFNLAYKPEYFRQALTVDFARRDHCVLVFHFHELAPGAFKHELLSYRVEDAFENLRCLVGFLKEKRRNPHFVSPSIFLEKRRKLL